jgi:hypothetical protein
MGIVVANEPDPNLIGQYAYEAGKAPAVRENIVESRRLAQDAAKTGQQLAFNAQQNALDRQQKTEQMQVAQAARLQDQQVEQAGYAALNEQKRNEAALDRQQQAENAEANRRLQREKEFNDSVAAGLKDGSLYYAPQQKQELAQVDQAIAKIYGDESIAPEQQDEMAARLHQKRRGIIPMVRPENERPVPIEQEMGNNTVVHTADGRVIPLSQLGRAAQPGEMIGTMTTRNGAKQMNWKDVKPIKAEAEAKPTAEEKAWSNPAVAMSLENNVRTQLQADLDVAYKNELAAWKRKEAAHKAAEQAKVEAIPEGSDEVYTPKPFDEKPPQLQLPTKESVGHELYRRSGGRTGIMPPEKTAEILQQAVSTMSGAAREAGEAALKLFLGSTPAQKPPQPSASPGMVNIGEQSFKVVDMQTRDDGSQIPIIEIPDGKGDVVEAFYDPQDGTIFLKRPNSTMMDGEIHLVSENGIEGPEIYERNDENPKYKPLSQVSEKYRRKAGVPASQQQSPPSPQPTPPAQYDASKKPPKYPPNAVFVRADDDAAFDRLPPGTVVYDEFGRGGVK